MLSAIVDNYDVKEIKKSISNLFLEWQVVTLRRNYENEK